MSAKMLEDLFNRVGVFYEKILHPKRDTAYETALAEGEDPSHVAKVVIVESRGKHVMFVLPADRKLDLFKVADACDDENVRIVYEHEFSRDFPGDEVGAEPPFGSFYGMPCFLDAALTLHPTIVFSAGTHTESFKISTSDYVDLATPQVGDYAIRKSRATARP